MNIFETEYTLALEEMLDTEEFCDSDYILSVLDYCRRPFNRGIPSKNQWSKINEIRNSFGYDEINLPIK